ncbi:leucine-rich repeat domain-containing protein [Tessaracoccus sp. Y36]
MDNPSFVKVINGIRADFVLDGQWWTYWHRHWSDDSGWGSWTLSDLGASSYTPEPGSVEGWSVSPSSVFGGVAPRWAGYAPGELPDPAPFAPVIEAQPVDVVTETGYDARFTVAVKARPTPVITWESSTDGVAWVPVDGATGATLTLASVALADDGRQVRAVATNEAGTLRSEPAGLAVTDPTAVEVPDAKFRLCLTDRLGIAADKPLSQKLLTGLTGELTCAASKYRTITDVTGAEHLTGISSLSFSGHKVADLTPLSGLKNLETLTLTGNALTDVSALAGLTGLTSLWLATNQITDVTPLAGLTDLTSLMLNSNAVSDAGALSSLLRLKTVGLSRNQLTSVSNLVSDSIGDLTIDANSIAELDLSGMPNLTRVVAHDNGFSSLESLRGLTSLQTFAAQGNQISDLAPLSGLPSLASLLVSKNKISDVTPLAAFESLTSLDLSSNAIVDLSPLQDLVVTDASKVRARYQSVEQQVDTGRAVNATSITHLDGSDVALTLPATVSRTVGGRLVFEEPGAYTLTWNSTVTGRGTFAGSVLVTAADPVPVPTPTVTATAVVTETAMPVPAPTVTATAVVTHTVQATAGRTAPYTRPGLHDVGGRRWYTDCETYSVTERCRTDIWATTVTQMDGRYEVRQGWAFNNLTYLPVERAVWEGNPLAATGEWRASDGRDWRTECDTAATGHGACRSYVRATAVSAKPGPAGAYRFEQHTGWRLNNIVLFS